MGNGQHDPGCSPATGSVTPPTVPTLLPYIYIYIQGVTGGTDHTSGGCSLC
jgi:hypothetical protein